MSLGRLSSGSWCFLIETVSSVQGRGSEGAGRPVAARHCRAAGGPGDGAWSPQLRVVWVPSCASDLPSAVLRISQWRALFIFPGEYAFGLFGAVAVAMPNGVWAAV